MDFMQLPQSFWYVMPVMADPALHTTPSVTSWRTMDYMRIMYGTEN